MSVPGWFPDPGGEPGRYRYWSGSTWSEDTAPNPFGPPPRPRRAWPLIVGAIVILVALGLLAAYMASPRNSQPPSATEASPTGSVWDETSPSSSTSPSSATPSPSGGRPVDCDINTENRLPQATVRGGRLQVGHLSMAAASGWSGPSRESRMPYGRDTWGFSQTIASETKMGWVSSMSIGVATFEGDTSLETMVQAMTMCVVTSSFYRSVDVTVLSFSTKDTTISGFDAVRGDALLSFRHPSLNTTGSRVKIVVTKTPGATQFFFSAVPQENAGHIALIDATIQGLQVS